MNNKTWAKGSMLKLVVYSIGANPTSDCNNSQCFPVSVMPVTAKDKTLTCPWINTALIEQLTCLNFLTKSNLILATLTSFCN